MKIKYIRTNNSPFMNKDLSKATMVRSRLKNKSLKLKTKEAKDAYKKQRNVCVSILRQFKKNFYEHLNPSLISDNKKFWKQVKPFFSDKTPKNTKIMLSEDNKIVSNPVNCAEIFNNFFIDAIKNLDIDRTLHTETILGSDNPIVNATNKFKTHPSVLRIIQEGYLDNNFSLEPISELEIQYIINKIDISKAYQKEDIPPKVLKENADICSVSLFSDINRCINNGIFPNNLKNANIIPTFKKKERMHKTNYRPISILPTLSKVYEKVIYHQIYKYFNNIFSKYLCGFRKGHSTQHSLLFMLEAMKRALDEGLFSGVLLTDLSKAFDCISHELLIAKLHAYGFSKQALNLINDYLSNRYQRTKVGDKVSKWQELIIGVPQGSVLGPLLFNIYINDLFLFSQHFNMANYADDCSPYEFSGSIDDIIKLQNDSKCLIKWFKSNYLKPNPEKWHLLLSDKSDDFNIKIETEEILNSKEEKILGVYFDNKLNFNTHIKKLCQKASQKLHALARLSNLMSIRQRKIIMDAFINSQFSYCPLIWMCHNRNANSMINNIHERALRIVYKDNNSSFNQLLEKSGSVSIHHRNLRVLAIEIYKGLNKLSSHLMTELFKVKETKYSFRK